MENNFKNFITHNKKHFKKTNIINNNDKILIEFNGWSSTHIWGSYLVNVLLNKYKCKILAYEGYTLISSDLSHTIYFKINTGYICSLMAVSLLFNLANCSETRK